LDILRDKIVFRIATGCLQKTPDKTMET